MLPPTAALEDGAKPTSRAMNEKKSAILGTRELWRELRRLILVTGFSSTGSIGSKSRHFQVSGGSVADVDSGRAKVLSNKT
jgi:hypothetical protein